jgi:prepilin-type N-terminal cleavage/methylation domain-containing protein
LPRSGFTLVELLAVVGIIGVLVGLLLPATSAARRDARAIQCQNNIRQLALGVVAYVAEFKQKYPPNLNAPSPGQWWCDDARVGAYVPPLPTGAAADGNAVWVCPEDEAPVRRSYSMNYWASSKVDFDPPPPVYSSRWGPGEKRAARLLLLTESWSSVGFPSAGYATQPVVGMYGTAGQRFGGGGGLPLFSAGRFGLVNCELAFARHRRIGAPGQKNQPRGRIVIAFADAHVELLDSDALVDYGSGTVSGLCAWSPLDLR